MGYTTDFEGHFTLNKPLSNNMREYLIKFNETRRMKRNLPLHYGVDGEFYVDGGGMYGQDRESNIVDFNQPPSTQPGLWCQWRPNDDGTAIKWDGSKKFYSYQEWIIYLIQNFLHPNGYILNGIVTWQGEDDSDFGKLIIKDNLLYIDIGLETRSFHGEQLFEIDSKKDQRIVLFEQSLEHKLLGESNEEEEKES